MALTVTLAGADVTAQVAGFRTARGIQTVGTCTLEVIDQAGTLRPRPFDALVIDVDSDTVFRGTVTRVRLGTAVSDTWRIFRLECRDDTNHRAQRVFRNDIVPAGESLKAVLELLEANLSAVGVSLDPLQADGPTLPELTLPWQRVAQVLDLLSTLTGWIWAIDSDLVLAMWPIGSRAAPMTFSAANENIDVGIEWDEENLSYRNGQWLIFGGSQTIARDLRVEGDGATRVFPLHVTVATPPTEVYDEQASAYRHVGIKGVDTLFEWVWDSAAGAIEQLADAPPGTPHDPLAAGEFLTIPVTAQYPQAIYVSDDDEQTAQGVYDDLATNDAIVDYDAAVAYAEALIRQSIDTPQRITLPTRTLGNDPGEVATVSDTTLDLSDGYLIETEELLYQPLPDEDATAYVTARLGLIGGSDKQESFLDRWKRWRSSGLGTAVGGGGVAGGAGATVAVAAGLGPIPLATRRDGAFTPGTSGAAARDFVLVAIDASKVASGVVTVRCDLQRTTGSGTLTPQLRCVDDGTVRGAGTAANPSSLTTQTPFTATLVAGVKRYALYLVGSDATTEGIVVGTVEA